MKLLINLKTGVSIRTELQIDNFKKVFNEVIYGNNEWLVTNDVVLRIEDIASIFEIKKEQQSTISYHCSNPTKEQLEKAFESVKMCDFGLI